MSICPRVRGHPAPAVARPEPLIGTAATHVQTRQNNVVLTAAARPPSAPADGPGEGHGDIYNRGLRGGRRQLGPYAVDVASDTSPA